MNKIRTFLLVFVIFMGSLPIDNSAAFLPAAASSMVRKLGCSFTIIDDSIVNGLSQLTQALDFSSSLAGKKTSQRNDDKQSKQNDPPARTVSCTPVFSQYSYTFLTTFTITSIDPCLRICLACPAGFTFLLIIYSIIVLLLKLKLFILLARSQTDNILIQHIRRFFEPVLVFRTGFSFNYRLGPRAVHEIGYKI
jgi:hypothetical protein